MLCISFHASYDVHILLLVLLYCCIVFWSTDITICLCILPCWAPRLFPVGAVISQTTLIMRVSVSLCVHVCASKCVCMKLCVYIMFYCNKASECFVSFCGHTTSSWCCLSPQVTVSICGCGGKAVRKPMPLSSETTHLCSSLLLYKSNYLRCSSNPRVSWELQL